MRITEIRESLGLLSPPIVGHLLCILVRTHHRKDKLPLRLLRELRSCYVFAPVRPSLARWEHEWPQGTRGSR